jgi:Amt family ammonium transporter
MERVLADVDSACYVAKQSGRNRVHVTQDDDAEVVKYRSNLAGIQAIRKALTDDRLALFYQPIFQIEERSVMMTHCEILLRIRSENGEMYSPARFIPIAEKYNIMTEIDQWVFTNVIDWLAEHQGKQVIPRLLVNLSGLSFTDEDFSRFIVERLSRGDVDPSHIAFEISESAAVRNFEKVSVFIERIRALGCELALDDFGSGFSSFAYLKKLSFDYLKIDGSLVRNIASNTVDHDMVAAINQIGHTVGAKTIAEFVEDDAALNCLREMKVDFAQGYGLRMPTPLTQLAEELQSLAGADSSSNDGSDQALSGIAFRKAS